MVSANTALFIAMGLAAGVRTKLSLPLMAALSATPAVGLVPYLAVRMRNGQATVLVVAAVLALSASGG